MFLSQLIRIYLKTDFWVSLFWTTSGSHNETFFYPSHAALAITIHINTKTSVFNPDSHGHRQWASPYQIFQWYMLAMLLKRFWNQSVAELPRVVSSLPRALRSNHNVREFLKNIWYDFSKNTCLNIWIDLYCICSIWEEQWFVYSVLETGHNWSSADFVCLFSDEFKNFCQFRSDRVSLWQRRHHFSLGTPQKHLKSIQPTQIYS